jgi:hypothetical protein
VPRAQATSCHPAGPGFQGSRPPHEALRPASRSVTAVSPLCRNPVLRHSGHGWLSCAIGVIMGASGIKLALPDLPGSSCGMSRGLRGLVPPVNVVNGPVITL